VEAVLPTVYRIHHFKINSEVEQAKEPNLSRRRRKKKKKKNYKH
jgi:hypothetical protein